MERTERIPHNVCRQRSLHEVRGAKGTQWGSEPPCDRRPSPWREPAEARCEQSENDLTGEQCQNEEDDKNGNGNEEQPLGYGSSSCRNVRESQEAGDDGNQEEDEGPFQHRSAPDKMSDSLEANRTATISHAR